MIHNADGCLPHFTNAIRGETGRQKERILKSMCLIQFCLWNINNAFRITIHMVLSSTACILNFDSRYSYSENTAFKKHQPIFSWSLKKKPFSVIATIVV